MEDLFAYPHCLRITYVPHLIVLGLVEGPSYQTLLGASCLPFLF